jgi:PPE-repeat protein
MSAVSQALQTLTSNSQAPTGLSSLGSLSDIAAVPVDLTMDSAIIGAIFGGDAVSWGISAVGLPAAAPVSLTGAPGESPGLVSASKSLGGAAVSAGVGQAASLSGMTVPQGWATAAPELRLAAAESPISNVVAAEGRGLLGGTPLLGGAPLMTMTGRGMADSRDRQDPDEIKRKAKGRRSTMR